MSKNLFNSIKLTKPKNNVFDLTHDVKLSLNMGELVPIMCTEAVPGDKFKISAESILRFAPLVSPVMHRMDVTMHYFFVPNRILWDNWEKWIVNEPGTTITAPFVTIKKDESNYTPLVDYLGLPLPSQCGQVVDEDVSALPFAAYQKIYNEYYRDQNLIPEVPFLLTDGDNTLNTDLFDLRVRAWEHDYFTSSLPWAQKGAAVDIPLGDVELKNNWWSAGLKPTFQNSQGSYSNGSLSVDATQQSQIELSSTPTLANAYDPKGTLEVQATTINELRRAYRLQEWLERNARGGTRYIENILAHFGVRSSDKRLQRPEYITGVKSPVVISEILNTTGTQSLPQGNMAGHGISVTSGKFGDYYCEEHGWIIGIMSVMPKTAYQQGIPKHFLKKDDPFQFFWPTFAHLGEQEVQNKEVFAFVSNGEDTFGYVPRYAEYKYQPSRVAGDFRTSLDFWHLGRIFANQPTLSQQFVQCDPTTRVFAVQDNTQKLYAHVLNKVLAVRPMPKFGTPMT